MKEIYQIFMVLVLLASLFFMIGCASQQINEIEAGDLWTGEWTGDITGKIQLYFSVTDDKAGEVADVYGKSKLKITSIVGEGSLSATANFTLKGTVKDAVFKAEMTGRGAEDFESDSSVLSGEMIGTISKATGFGIWKITDLTYNERFSGEWTLKKITE